MRSEMEQDILKVLVTEEELKARIQEMGDELYDRFQGKDPLFLSVLKGSFVFMADLVCLLYTSPSPRDDWLSRMPSSA